MPAITWADKVEDGGATAAGRLSAADANQIKSVVNAKADADAVEPLVTSVSISGSTNLIATHNRKRLVISGTAPTLTLQLQSAGLYAADFICWGISAQALTIDAPAGVKLNGVDGANLTIPAENAGGAFELFRKPGVADEWICPVSGGGGDVSSVSTGVTDGHAVVFNSTSGSVMRTAGFAPWREPYSGTASANATANPTLAAGRIGIETDTLALRLGNGSTAYNSLARMNVPPGAGFTAELEAQRVPNRNSGDDPPAFSMPVFSGTGHEYDPYPITPPTWLDMAPGLLDANLFTTSSGTGDVALNFRNGTGDVSNDLRLMFFHTMGAGNNTLRIPSNMAAGMVGQIWFLHPSTGTRTLSLEAGIYLMGDLSAWSTAADAINVLNYQTFALPASPSTVRLGVQYAGRFVAV